MTVLIIVNLVNSPTQSRLAQYTPPTGFPDIEPIYAVKYDASKQTRIFGMKYRLIEETTKDILDDFVKRGW